MLYESIMHPRCPPVWYVACGDVVDGLNKRSHALHVHIPGSNSMSRYKYMSSMKLWCSDTTHSEPACAMMCCSTQNDVLVSDLGNRQGMKYAKASNSDIKCVDTS